MNTPNKLTVLRIFLVPIFILFLINKSIYYNFLWAEIIFCIASITDHFDGKIARKNNQITDFGKFLDPLADKILVTSAFVCFIELGLIPSWAVVIILAREFIVTSMRLIAAGKGKVIAANIWGKLKTVSQMTAIIFSIEILFLKENLELTGDVFYVLNSINIILIWISILMTIISGVVYIKENFELIKNAK